MAKGDKTINAVVVTKAGLVSLADISNGIRKGTIDLDIVEPNRAGDAAVLIFSMKAPASKP